jgi:rare lipoprotein A
VASRWTDRARRLARHLLWLAVGLVSPLLQAQSLADSAPESSSPLKANATDPVEAAPLARGQASWYGQRFHGKRTASGERFDMHAFTAAHRSLPFGTRVRVRSLATGREVVVRINDRGPAQRSRVIDLSWAAARELGVHKRGVSQVELLRE